MRRPAFSLTWLTLLLAGVGFVDAFIGSAWDLVVVFGAIAFAQVVTLARALDTRVAVSLRPDLARWAAQRSQRTGEPVTDVVDRAVALFQHGLYGTSTDEDTGHLGRSVRCCSG